MLHDWHLLPIEDQDIVDAIALEPHKIRKDLQNHSLFPENNPKQIRDLIYDDIEQLMAVKGSLSKIMQAGIILQAKDFRDKIKQHYFTNLPEEIYILFEKYLFNIKQMTALDWNAYVMRGRKPEYKYLFGHIEAVLKDPEYAKFMIEGDIAVDINDLVQKAAYVSYRKFLEGVEEQDITKAKVFGDLLIKAAKVKVESKKTDFIEQVKELKLKWEQQTMENTQLKMLPSDAVEPNPQEDNFADD